MKTQEVLVYQFTGVRGQFFEKTVSYGKHGFTPSNQLFYITAYFF